MSAATSEIGLTAGSGNAPFDVEPGEYLVETVSTAEDEH